MRRKKIKKTAIEKAQISSLLIENKSFSLNRLMHDYKEITNQEIPIPGVSAIPLDNNFYEWHGNIKALEDNEYKGTIIHFKLCFPKNYPIEPPKIYIFNSGVKHPNVMSDKTICLEILEKSQNKEDNKGWKSGYSVLSILLQLQTFFFDMNESSLYINSISEYKCSQCGHDGNSKPYPEFNEIKNKNMKLNWDQYKKAKIKEICCFHRKIGFKEGPLGLGISISKILRTGEIKEIIPCFDYISFKAYTKDKIRKGLNGQSFSYWFPLYFGEKKEEFLNSVKKAISMIVKGNSKEFEIDLILKVMPKFLNYINLNIINENINNTSRVFSIFIYIYRILLLFVQVYPEFKSEINKKVEEFIKNPKQRVKDKTPSLGDLLVIISVSEFRIEELLPSYISEQMDRQIFWILQEIPEFEKLINSSKVDEIREKICFKCGIIGQQLVLFYYYFIKKIVYYKNLDKFAYILDQNYCNLPEKEIDKHRQEINKILNIDNYNDFYKFIGIKPPNKEELNDKLKQAFINSKNKKYHGTDEIRYVPIPYKQIEYYMKKYEPIENLVENGKLISSENPKWENLLTFFFTFRELKDFLL